MKELLLKTAWIMTVPAPYSPFHLIISIAGICLAWMLAGRVSHRAWPCVRRILFVCGMILAVLTFMQDFNLLGGIMALAEPSGLLHPYWTLTMHGLVWHILLIFIGLLIGFSGFSDHRLKGFVRTLPLFGICCLIASFINVSTHTIGEANMFYISPYYPTSQAVFHEIAVKLGVMGGNVVYLASICLGGFFFHLFMRRASKSR